MTHMEMKHGVALMEKFRGNKWFEGREGGVCLTWVGLLVVFTVSNLSRKQRSHTIIIFKAPPDWRVNVRVQLNTENWLTINRRTWQINTEWDHWPHKRLVWLYELHMWTLADCKIKIKKEQLNRPRIFFSKNLLYFPHYFQTKCFWQRLLSFPLCQNALTW